MSKNKGLVELITLICTIILNFPLSSIAGGYIALNKQEISELMPSSTRFVESLSGKWEISTDDSEWNYAYLPYSRPQTSKIYYRHTFRIENELIDKYSWHLYFPGVDDEIEVYVNNDFVGKYFGGMTPFIVRIPSKMLYRQTNTLKIAISPASSSSRQVKEQNIFAKKIFTGAVREILLVGTPQIWISEVKNSMKFNRDYTSCELNTKVCISSGEIEKIKQVVLKDSLKTTISQSKAKVKIQAVIKYKPTGEIAAQTYPVDSEIFSNRTITINFPINVQNIRLWSPSRPELYEMQIKILNNEQLVDELSSDIGFRECKVSVVNNVNTVLLNGIPIDIKGLDYIEHDIRTGQTLTTERMKQDIKLILELGANLIKFKYSAPNPYFLNLCNKNGIMVLIELPIYDVPSSLINSDEIKVRMRNYGERMILAYENNPSVIAWGISNSVQESNSNLDRFSQAIISLFRNTSSKMIYKIVNLSSSTVNTEGFDFIGLQQIGRLKNLGKVKKEINRLYKTIDKPIFLNYGLTVQPQNHNGYSDPLSLESQANYIFNLYHFSENLGCLGSIIWSFDDYQLNNPLLILNINDQYLCTSGLVDEKRQQRISFAMVQSLFNKEKDPLLYAGSYTDKTPISFIVVGIAMCLIILFLFNRFKRFREYLFRSILRPYNFYADIRDQRIMSSAQTILLGIFLSLTIGLFVSSVMYYYRTNEIAQYLLMLIFPLNFLQEILFKLIWLPEIFILLCSIFFFICIFIVSFILKISSYFVRGRIFYSDTNTITVWSATPTLFLLPISIIITRLLIFVPESIWGIIGFSIFIFVWLFFRILRATSVVFDIRTYRSYILGIVVTILFGIIIFSIYQIQFSVISYAEFLFDMLIKF